MESIEGLTYATPLRNPLPSLGRVNTSFVQLALSDFRAILAMRSSRFSDSAAYACADCARSFGWSRLNSRSVCS